ncbi:MAG: hypothetical protein ABIH23_04200 [bacterium]
MESGIRFLRSFWQPIVVALLALGIIGQLGSWGYTALQMHSIDRLVDAAKSEKETKEKESTEQTQGRPPQSPGNPPQQPKANIFHRQRISYVLSAIYKDQAVINGQPVKAGGRVGEATVEEIRLASVMIHEDGKPQPHELEMFQGSGGGGPMPMPRSMGRGRPSSPPPSVQRAPLQMMPSSGPPPAVGPQGFSRERMMELGRQFRNGTLNINDLPPEMQAQAKEAMAQREARRNEGGGERGRGSRR